MAYKRISYNVRPRYTAGSPAMVNEGIARKVAAEEREFIEHALEGVWGEEQKARAEKLGLDFISYTLHETRTGWNVEDLITGKKHFWPFKAECPTCKAKRVVCQRGKLQPHYYKHYGECQDRSYVGKELRP